MKVILRLFGFLFFMSLHAQYEPLIEQYKMDSLNQVIKNHTGDSIKVGLLNDYARLNFYNLELIKGFEAASEARDLAKEIGFEQGEVMYHKTLAVFFGAGRDMYTYHVEKARLISSGINEKGGFEVPEIPDQYPPDTFSEVYEQNVLKAIDHFKDHKNKEILVCLYAPLSWYYYQKGDLEDTKRLHYKIKAIYKELGELYPIFLHNSYIIFIASSQRNVEEVQRLNEEMKNLVASINNQNTIGLLNFQLANYYRNNGELSIAIEHYLLCIDYFESTSGHSMLANVYFEMSNLYSNLEMFDKAADALEKRVYIIEENNLPEDMFNIYNQVLWAMYDAKEYEKARYYNSLRKKVATADNIEHYNADSYSLDGHILMDKGEYEKAIELLHKALEISLRVNRVWSDEWEAFRLADCYFHLGKFNKALQYAKQSEELLGTGNTRLRKILNLLFAEIYEAQGNETLAFSRLKNYKNLIKESEDINIANIVMKAELTSLLEENKKEIDLLEKEQLLTEQQNKNQRLWIFSIAGALFSVLILVLVLYRNNKQKQKANSLLSRQKEEIQNTLEQLKSAQAQLVQSEKMASLGELTAGIAHEIQNPLNFVKNFSEVSTELIDEMVEDLKSGKNEEVLSLAEEIKENQDRINHHGKRAGSIVRGMLQHSRTSSGELIETDLNNLCDEYLRLSYHGLRAKDKSFNADLQTELAKDLPKMKVIPQDFGRVLLNLINNAFYAVKDKSESSGKDFKPMVKVTTKLKKNQIEIVVADNGNGIPEEIKDKIFQPFFTTKPTGKGTGLGLSLSYDIVKAHGGELRVESIRGEGTEFKIELSLK